MEISHICKGPLTHFQSKMMKMTKEAKVAPPIFDLVFHTIDEIASNFNDLLEPTLLHTFWSPLLDIAECLGDEHKHYIYADAVTHVMELATEHHWRFVLTIHTFPYAFLWLVFAEPTVDSPQRRDVAHDLLTLPKHVLDDSTTWKLRVLFRPELLHARDTGMLDAKLYEFILDLGCHWTIPGSQPI